MKPAQLAMSPYRAVRYAWRTWRDARPVARKRRVSLLRIVREQIALKRLNGIRPDEYYYFGLDDPAMPWSEKITYLGDDRLRELWYLLTPRSLHTLFKNKLLFKHAFGAARLPVARLYGVYDPRTGQTSEGAPLRNARDIAAWMASSDVRDVVFKPVESAEGRMVLVMGGRKAGDPSRFVTLAGEEYTPESLDAFFNDPALLREAYPPEEYPDPPRTFLVEERLKPHPGMRPFAPDTLCCARVLTLTTLDGQVALLETAVKLQRGAVGIDNVIRGAIAVEVDPRTGVLGLGMAMDDTAATRREHLPDTDIRFTGFQLPMWPEVVSLATAAASVFPEAHTIGWDIALTDKGPCIIEGNAAWGSFQAECRQGLMKGAFKELVERLDGKAR